MTTSGITNLQRTSQSPALPADFGIVIRAEPYPPRAVGRLAVHGAYHLPRTVLDFIERPTQRAVVLVIQRLGEFNAVTPFRERLLFEDDDQLTPGGVAGYFNIDVFEEQGGGVPGEYHLFVSIDEHVSNVLEVPVGP